MGWVVIGGGGGGISETGVGMSKLNEGVNIVCGRVTDDGRESPAEVMICWSCSTLSSAVVHLLQHVLRSAY